MFVCGGGGIFLISIIFSYFCVKMLSNSFVFADDTETALFKNFTEIIVSKPSDGHYISSTLDSFFGAIMPIKLFIHQILKVNIFPLLKLHYYIFLF